MKLKFKLIILFVCVALIPFLFIGVLNFSNARQLLTEATLLRLNQVKDLKVILIEQAFEADTNIIKIVVESTQIKQKVAALVKNKSGLKDTTALLTEIKNSDKNFKSVFVADTNGVIIASTDQDVVGSSVLYEEFFIRGKTSESVGLFSGDESKQLIHSISAPLIVDDALVGVVVVQTYAQTFLNLFSDKNGLGETGETLLVLREGDSAIFSHPVKYDANAAFTRKVDLNDFNKPATKALRGFTGTFADTIDYRGVPVMSSTHYFAKSDAALVVKIDKSEALKPISSYTKSFFIVGIIVLLFVSLLVVILSKIITDPIISISKIAQDFADSNFNDYSTFDTYLFSTNDEVGTLFLTLKNMAKKISTYHSELEETVKQRTENLQKKSEELEAMNRIMIGREMKMIEMKKELEKLKK